MAVIANQALHLAVMKAAEVYVEAVSAAIGEAFAGQPETSVQATVGSSAVSMVVDRLAARHGALSAWTGCGQGLGMALAQMDSMNRQATVIVLEESVAMGVSSTLAAFTPAPGRPS